MDMHRQTERRRSIAWTLYASLLFAVLHCGLGHGQVIGLIPNGMGGAFCGQGVATLNPNSVAPWLGDTLASGNTIDCPLCSPTGLAFTSRLPVPPVAHLDNALPLTLPVAWPRQLWLAANPRASPTEA